jgi:hypothetical protein
MMTGKEAGQGGRTRLPGKAAGARLLGKAAGQGCSMATERARGHPCSKIQ